MRGFGIMRFCCGFNKDGAVCLDVSLNQLLCFCLVGLNYLLYLLLIKFCNAALNFFSCKVMILLLQLRICLIIRFR